MSDEGMTEEEKAIVEQWRNPPPCKFVLEIKIVRPGDRKPFKDYSEPVQAKEIEWPKSSLMKHMDESEAS